MFTVTYVSYITVPTCPAIFAFIILFCRWAAVLPVGCNRGCPRPKGYWALVNHMRAEPYHQVTGYFVNLDTLQDLSFTRRQPVLGLRRAFTYSKNIL